MCYNAIIYGNEFEKYLGSIFEYETRTNDDGFFIEKNGKIVRTIDKEVGKTALLEENNGDYQHFHFRAVSAGSHDEENVHGWEWYGFRVSHNGSASGGTSCGYYETAWRDYANGKCYPSSMYRDYDYDYDVTLSNKLYSEAKPVSHHIDTDSLEFLKSVEVPKEFTDDEIIRVFQEAIKKASLYGVLYVSKKNKSYVFSSRKKVHIYMASEGSLYISNEEISFTQNKTITIPDGTELVFERSNFYHATIYNAAMVIDAGKIVKIVDAPKEEVKTYGFKTTKPSTTNTNTDKSIVDEINSSYLPMKYRGQSNFLDHSKAERKNALKTIDNVINGIITITDSILQTNDFAVSDEGIVNITVLEEELQHQDTNNWAIAIASAYIKLNKRERKSIKSMLFTIDFEALVGLEAFCNKEKNTLPTTFVDWVHKFYTRGLALGAEEFE